MDGIQRAVLDNPELEAREEGGKRTISGYAAVFDSESHDLGGYIEVVRRGAFDEALAENPKVSARVQHEGGLTTIGSTENGTLRLAVDKKGLRYTVQLPDTQAGRDIYELVKGGYISKSSFAFSVRDANKGQRWNFDRQPPLRELLSLNLFDVAPVDGPAYEATTVEARSLALADMQRARGGAPVETAAQPEPEGERALDAMNREEIAALIAGELREARGKRVVAPEEERWDPKCAAHHFGLWACEPNWLNQAITAIKAGTWQAKRVEEDEESGARYEVTDDGLAVVNVWGPIMKGRSKFGGTSSILTRQAIRAAVGNENVRAVVLRIDSPGGTVAGTKDLADEVYRANMRKPVYAYIEDLGASAAYWVASQARKVWSNETAMIGCIGTVARVEDTSGAATMAGVKVHVISTGPYKGAFTPGAPVSADHLADLQREVDELNEFFLRAVAHGRGLTPEYVRQLADGRSHIGEKAAQLKLIDGVRGWDDLLFDIGLALDLAEVDEA
jgi:HK97 family phage prohead protease